MVIGSLVNSWLDCCTILQGAALEDYPEATAGLKCSNMDSNGHSSLCLCVTAFTQATVVASELPAAV